MLNSGRLTVVGTVHRLSTPPPKALLIFLIFSSLAFDVKHSLVFGQPIKGQSQQPQADTQPHTSHYGTKAMRKSRAAYLAGTTLWPDGLVYFLIDKSLATKSYIKLIYDAINEIRQNTCIRFEKCHRNCTHYLNITTGNQSDCLATSAGMNDTGPTIISLGSGCHSHGIIVHELTHMLGLQHEHQRPDRDEQLTVHLENIKEDKFISQFDTKADMITLTPMDIHSITIYGRNAFAKDNTETITMKDANKTLTNPREKTGLSELDIRGLNRLYNCTEKELML